ncbi:MAG: serine/threonine-protein kinase [Scytonema sp. PMC 1069.18]|nr:serine/threonine-protein kinase [Scytonema sp. PMC 1069.18]MEC4882482.1 serine/threonine-protein kinase [Scytonema sp. PMC 1070.18]
MTYCINPNCKNPHNPETSLFCCSCGSELLLKGRYQVIQIVEKRPYTAVYEVLEQGKEKILKVLEKPYNKLVELFEQEAKVLQELAHPGIPKRYGYFKFKVKSSPELFPCLVMEKIQGVNLQKYIEHRENRPIEEELVLQWSFKLVNILDAVHEEKLFHRDIKPSNIMLKYNGELVLIDFGAVREITDTYLDSLAREKITAVFSQGYTAPEQLQGKASQQSDFFALGRTLVYLLTGDEPSCLFKNPNDKNRLLWREQASVSNQFADFIDQLMDPIPENRPKDTKTLLKKLAEIQENFLPTQAITSDIEIPPNQRHETFKQNRRQKKFSLRRTPDNQKTFIFSPNQVVKNCFSLR